MAKKTNTVTTEGTTERIINGIKLESVPLPTDWHRGAQRKYPLAEMQVGESFEILGKKELNSVRTSTHKFQGSHDGYKFATRAVMDGAGKPLMRDGVEVFRCWRIEVPTND